MNQPGQRQVPSARGVFESPMRPEKDPLVVGNVRPSTAAPVPEQKPTVKEDFPDVFRTNQQMINKTMDNLKNANKPADREMAEANKINDAMGESPNTIDPDEDKITPEELVLAEQLIFKGYAEKEVEMLAFPGKKFTICSTSAEEISVIDEIIFDMIKSVKSNEDGTVDVPENHIKSMRNALYVALSYKGCDKKELSQEAICYLNTLKKAIFRINDMMNDGKLKDAKELNESMKKALIKRATIVKRLPTTVVDFLSGEKYKFDSRMSEIMSMKGIVSKS